MKGIERAIVVSAIVYMLLYLPYFFIQVFRIEHGASVSLVAIAIPHAVGMGLNLLALIATLRDLYLRPFQNANSKLTWGLLIVCTGGIGWLIYLCKYAFKPRTVDRD